MKKEREIGVMRDAMKEKYGREMEQTAGRSVANKETESKSHETNKRMGDTVIKTWREEM